MILYNALEFLRLNLNTYIVESGNSPGADDEPVKLGNIAFVEDDASTTDIDESNRVFISLVNLQEEFAFKNLPAVKKTGELPKYVNPPIYLNLFVLITANHKNYGVALKMLSLVVEYFQGNNTFSVAGNPVPDSPFASLNEGAEVKISMDLYSLTFEQLNHLWGALGGKQAPFALYKMRVVKVDKDQQKRGGGFIKEIETVHP